VKRRNEDMENSEERKRRRGKQQAGMKVPLLLSLLASEDGSNIFLRNTDKYLPH
jgi:hypothetical protein